MKKIAAALLMLGLAVFLAACSASDYKKAESLVAEEEWDGAREILEELGDYKDSALLLKKCDLGDAEYYMGRGKWKKARAILEDLADEEYEDSAELLEECYYEEAAEKFQEGDIEETLKLLKKAGSGEKVKELSDAILFLQAVEAFEDERFDEAEEMFARLGDHEGAEEYRDALNLIRAEQHYDRDEYEETLKLLEGRTDDDSLELHEDALCNWVDKVYYEDHDYEKCLWIIDTYGTEEEQQYKLDVAEEMACRDKEYEGALNVLEGLEDSDEVRELYSELLDLWLEELSDAGDIDACLEVIDRYCPEEDVQEYKYLLAAELYEDGQLEKALEILDTLGDYKDCREAAEAIRKELAVGPLAGNWTFDMDITEMFYQLFANQMSDEREHFTELCGGKAFFVPMTLSFDAEGGFTYEPDMYELEQRLEKSLPMLEDAFYASFQEMILSTLAKNGYPDATWDQVLQSYDVTNTADCFTAYVGTTAEQCIYSSFTAIMDYYYAYGASGSFAIRDGKLILTTVGLEIDLTQSSAFTAEDITLTLETPEGDDIFSMSYPLTLYREGFAPEPEEEPLPEPEPETDPARRNAFMALQDQKH